MDENKIQSFENKRIRTVWDEEKQEWYLSVSDVVTVLTDSADVRQYIKKMRSRDPELHARWGSICTLTAMTAADGKKYHIDTQRNNALSSTQTNRLGKLSWRDRIQNSVQFMMKSVFRLKHMSKMGS